MTLKFYTTITCCLMLLFALDSSAQNYKYTVATSSEAYVPLGENAASVDDYDDWANFYFAFEVPIGFSSPILDVPTEGFLNFFAPNILLSENIDEYDYDAPLAFLFATTLQLQNRAAIEGGETSSINYITEGNASERIFKLEFDNAGFAAEYFELNSTDMYLNQQLWIYEATGCIEFRFGEHSITNDIIYEGDTGPTYGLFLSSSNLLSNDEVKYSITLAGDPASPSVVELENAISEPAQLVGHPAEGTVYTFCPAVPLATPELDVATNWEIFPNPVEDVLNIDWQETKTSSYSIVSMTGKVLAAGNFENKNNAIDVQNLAVGTYLLKIKTTEGIAVKRFVKIAQ